MTDELLTATREFLAAFEAVFDDDWKYTQSMLGIPDVSLEKENIAKEFGLEPIHIISPDGTFLKPGVDDEIEDWGHRGLLLERYRRLKTLISG